jgi:hypothetical protein
LSLAGTGARAARTAAKSDSACVPTNAHTIWGAISKPSAGDGVACPHGVLATQMGCVH